MTALGAVLQSQEEVYLEVVKHITRREKVTSIYIVNNSYCNFIGNIVGRQKQFETSIKKNNINHYYQ